MSLIKRYKGKRFLGNTNKKEVHDLNKEDTSQNGCQIEEIVSSNHATTFDPDTLEQAKKEGYDNCDKCLGNSKR